MAALAAGPAATPSRGPSIAVPPVPGLATPAAAPRPAVLPVSRGLAVSGMVASTAGTDPAAARRPPASTYLALGDSIAFGFDPTAAQEDAGTSLGYPAEVARALSRTAVNASCPGETTASFLSATGEDQGCRGFRARFPLHVAYPGTQMAFATEYLRTHPSTDLVSLGIGINDLYHCNRVSADRCARELTGVLATYRFNLTTIVRGLRAVYSGPLVLVDYYSPNYQDRRITDAVARLNAIMAETARTYQAGLARTFGVFAGVGVASRDICAAGLLIRLPDRCDIHPSPGGRALMAATVIRVAESTGPARPGLEPASYGSS
jgi:lysophospholipase L1-like esterase